MRSFGRTCRGKQKVYLSLVRDTERQVLKGGQHVRALGLSVLLHLQEDVLVEETLHERLGQKLSQALQTHKLVEQQSRRLVNGKTLGHCKIINPYDVTLAPIKKGKSNCPTQFGRKPGLIAEVATGFIFGLHLPDGNPDDRTYMMPLLDQVGQAILKLGRKRKPTIHSVATDLGFRDENLQRQLHTRSILTVGMPQTTNPIPAVPTCEMVQTQQQETKFDPPASKTRIKIAYACGYRRPVVESLIECLASKGATRIKYKGHRGAIIQTTAAILACNGDTLVRIKHNRISKKAQRFRRFFGLKTPNLIKNNTC
tara:strand:- start:29 stop:964 length:936 start_codon:yes stop_codon:yes gene_type:complete